MTALQCSQIPHNNQSLTHFILLNIRFDAKLNAVFNWGETGFAAGDGDVGHIGVL